MSLQEEQLFGAPPGDITAVSLQITRYEEGRWGLWLLCHTEMRNTHPSLLVTLERGQDVHTVVGQITPWLMKSGTMSANAWRRWAWATHNRLGALGYQVELKHCGREPKH